MSGAEIPVAAAGAGEAAAGAGALSWLTPEVAAGLAVGGTAAQMLAAQQQRKQQRAILNRQFDKTDKATQEGAQAVISEGANQGGAAQLAAMKSAEDAATARTTADLKGAGADIIDTAGGEGAQSQAFLTAKADRALSEGNRQTAIARELAKVRSTGEVQTNNGMSRAALAERLGSVGSTLRAGAQAAQLDAADVQAPWYGDVGKIASLVGTIGMINPAVAAPTTATTTLAPATLGEAGAAGSTALGAVKFGDGATRAATLGGTAAGGMSPMAASLARLAPTATMFGARRGWAGR